MKYQFLAKFPESTVASKRYHLFYSTLKEEIKNKEEKLERNEQLLATVQSENKKLAEPLRKAKEQLVELQRQLGSQEKEKGALISATSKLKVSQKKVESLSWEVEVLQQKYDRAISKFANFRCLRVLFSKESLLCPSSDL